MTPAATIAAARRATLAEVLACLKDGFLDTAAYPRKSMAQTRTQFDNFAATDLIYAIETYAGMLAKHEAKIKVWAAFEAAYLPGDTTGATWVTMGNLVDRMISQQLFDAGYPDDGFDAIQAGVEAQKIAGRATALREVRDMITHAVDKIAHAAPDPIV